MKMNEMKNKGVGTVALGLNDFRTKLMSLSLLHFCFSEYLAKGTRPSILGFGQGDSAKYSRIRPRRLGQVFSDSAKGTRPSILGFGQGDSAMLLGFGYGDSAKVFSDSAKGT